jgi:hypothetical protein
MLGVALAGALATSALAKPAASTAKAALPPVTLEHCSWNHPGVNPFMGDVVGAVDRYADIPAPVRARLKERIARRDYDDIVSIKRDSIRGKADYGNAISDMHFGTHQVCHSVTRAEWTAQMEERGLVYCEQGQCILIPTVCRNVSRIARNDAGGTRPANATGPVAAAPADAAVDDPALFADPLALPAFGSEAWPMDAFDPAGTSDLGDPGNAAAPGSFAGDPGFGGPPSIAGGAEPPGMVVIGGPVPRPTGTSGDPGDPSPPVSPVPEPQTWVLLLGGLALLAWRARARQRRSSGFR